MVEKNKLNRIPKYPKKLNGEFWGITAFFNPARYENKYENYKSFRACSKLQGLKLITVELVFDNQPFELKKSDAEILIQIRGNKSSLLWQKERLLNIAIDNLPSECDKFAWFDCDIIFKDKEWIKKASQLLEEYEVIQLFSYIIRMKKGVRYTLKEDFPEGNSEGEKMYGMAYRVANSTGDCFDSFSKHGDTGFAWAFRKEIFKNLRLYDHSITGSGDMIMAHGIYNSKANYYQEHYSKAFKEHLKKWISKIYKKTRGSIFYLDTTILHLWHGDKKHRNYTSRHLLLKKYDFNPEKDIRINENKIWAWASNKPEFHKQVGDYFWIRNEIGKNDIGISSFFNKTRLILTTNQSYHQRMGRLGKALKILTPRAYNFLKDIKENLKKVVFKDKG